MLSPNTIDRIKTLLDHLGNGQAMASSLAANIRHFGDDSNLANSTAVSADQLYETLSLEMRNLAQVLNEQARLMQSRFYAAIVPGSSGRVQVFTLAPRQDHMLYDSIHDDHDDAVAALTRIYCRENLTIVTLAEMERISLERRAASLK